LSQLLVRFFDVVQAPQAVEGLLWVVVGFAIADALKSDDGIGQRDVCTWKAGELLCDEEVLVQEALEATCALNGDLVLFRQLVHTQNRDNILQFLVLLQNVDHALCNSVVTLTNDAWLENTRSRGQWVHSWVDTLGSNCTVKLGGCIQVSECRRWSWVGVVIGRDVNGLQRRNRLTLGRGNALLE